ncbi:TBC1 domain family member 20-like [Teratosphaeria destructans]|uniref:TBC1 domain family member 20-like n=1 Tax=Teratosphaeria destructans TaxID=418781 RepID=A0A9W7SNY2_9PEZI|nr:TBC1 domain family member 20-like [Teratosphaeria destructans]
MAATTSAKAPDHTEAARSDRSASALMKPSNSDKGSASTGDNGIPVPPLKLSATWRSDPLIRDKGAKVHDILKACHDVDVDWLRQLAASEGGLVEDELRRTAWPILLGCDPRHRAIETLSWEKLAPHHDEHQVELDVNRSFVYYPEDETESRKDARKVELSNLITEVLRRHPLLHYFQGYHDIVQVLLLVLGANAAVEPVARLSLLRIRDFMLPSMTGTESYLRLLPAILYAVDPEVYQHLSHTQPFFALAATLTLYAHDIEEYGDIARLFDFLLASEASVSLYLFAVIVVSRKKELMEIEADEPEMLHAILSKLPKPLDLEHLIHCTTEAFDKYPPEKLPGRAWSHVSSYSVLKTTHLDETLQRQTLEDGERWFEMHDQEIQRKEAWLKRQQRARLLLRQYRRPAAFTGLAVLFALVAYMARDEGRVSSLMHVTVPLVTRLRDGARDLLNQYMT